MRHFSSGLSTAILQFVYVWQSLIKYSQLVPHWNMASFCQDFLGAIQTKNNKRAISLNSWKQFNRNFRQSLVYFNSNSLRSRVVKLCRVAKLFRRENNSTLTSDRNCSKKSMKNLISTFENFNYRTVNKYFDSVFNKFNQTSLFSQARFVFQQNLFKHANKIYRPTR